MNKKLTLNHYLNGKCYGHTVFIRNAEGRLIEQETVIYEKEQKAETVTQKPAQVPAYPGL